MAKRKRLTAPVLPTSGALGTGQDKTPVHPNDIPAGIIPNRRAPIADVAGQASAVAALEKVAAEMTAARAEGRMVQKIPLEAIASDYLARDRVVLDPAEMDALKASLRARGQQTPIEVVQTTPGQYGLISGFRRVQALRDLARDGDETGASGLVLAFVRQPGDASQAYTAMVEENEIRVGLSYFERAHIVRRCVIDDVFPSEAEALKCLFSSASRAKRSKIKSFLPVIEHLGSSLLHPNALTERAGLALAARLAQDPKFAPRLRDRLRKAQPETAAQETQLLAKALADTGTPNAPSAGPTPSRRETTEPKANPKTETIKVVFQPGDLRLTGVGVTQALADKIQGLLDQG